MQKNYKENHLKSYAVKTINSKGRLFKEREGYIRSPYQRDRDRIIHSSSFRRLKHKTQVFVNTEGDHYRTRLTHSMEVSQIARTLARSLGLNDVGSGGVLISIGLINRHCLETSLAKRT